MMYKYEGVLLTTNVNKNSHLLSEEALKSIVVVNPRVPVTVNFVGDPIGYTKDFYQREDGSLICSFELAYPNMDQLSLFLVPNMTVELKDIEHLGLLNETMLLKRVNLIQVALTTEPADPALTSISKKENQEDFPEERNES